MAATNTYTVNGESAQMISGGSADIDMSIEPGVKAGCKQYPIPLLNKITVTSTDEGLSSSKTIYAGYKIVEQMLGALVPAGNYNLNTPILNTIIFGGQFGIFEPAHYNSDTGKWAIHDLNSDQINSLINVGTGIKICVKIDYTKSDSSPATVYVAIPGASDRFSKHLDVDVPYYEEIGVRNLADEEVVDSSKIVKASCRTWFDSVLTTDNLNAILSLKITDPDTTQDMTVTLMAYIGSTPTADNTFRIQPMTSGSQTSVTVKFETYEPTITISNADTDNNPDTYDDGYGSVAEYNRGSEADTTISIEILPPA
ncbi:MAG: hypothetical protein RBT04_08705 [Sphaerochaetaceae bacterium]|jgi:hypothetical protein|nr:hypothetical protein [Sphaerochaetaceae bacterium]